MNYSDIENVLEVFYNQTKDYDIIADQVNLTVTDVANIINDYLIESLK